MQPRRIAPALLALFMTAGATADEGMWTFNDFPNAAFRQRYGFELTSEWLDHLRLSSVRIAGGCSASIVSAAGLVMTNHHCVRRCIESLSGPKRRDPNRDGFFAKTAADEARCPGMELNQLEAISDVTPRVRSATLGVAAERFADAQKAALVTIEKECATSDEVRCEVISLYRGGRHDLYQYRRFQDVRLVFAPEDAIAFFGGDPDNFMFPRYDLDVAFLRMYGRDGRPTTMKHHLAWSDGSLREGDVTFVAGNPGGTSRAKTLAQIEDERDMRLPKEMNRASEMRGYLVGYQHRGPEQQRHSNEELWSFENWLKSMKGQHAALADRAFFGQLAEGERSLRARIGADPDLERRYGDVWDRIATLVDRERAVRNEYDALERGLHSTLFDIARKLLRHADEIGKPNSERLKEYSDARLPQMRQRVLAVEPIHDELEIALLGWSLNRMREELGPDHPAIRRVLGARTPVEVATRAVRGSRLKDLRIDAAGQPVGLRRELYDGGKPRVDASTDPMIQLARSFDAEARAARKRFETEIDGPLKQQQERLAEARIAAGGGTTYPDATFTLRLSYGAVRGYVENGAQVAPFTTLAGVYARHTGAAPYALPPSWLKARPRLRLDTPMNFVTTNDIIGGNSGSPVVDRHGAVVGLVFDGNIQSLGGDYGFDESVNRTVAVHAAAILEALDKVYGATRLVRELRGGASPAGSGPR